MKTIVIPASNLGVMESMFQLLAKDKLKKDRKANFNQLARALVLLKLAPNLRTITGLAFGADAAGDICAYVVGEEEVVKREGTPLLPEAPSVPRGPIAWGIKYNNKVRAVTRDKQERDSWERTMDADESITELFTEAEVCDFEDGPR